MFCGINLLGTNERLLSFEKPVMSSPLWAYPRWPASNAVKLINESNILQQCTWDNDGSVAIGAGINRFWQVDLQGNFFITKVQVLGFNRPSNDNDGLTTHFKNVQINVCQDDQGEDCTNCNHALLNVGERVWGARLCSENIKGRYIRLLNENTGISNWHFCRVEVYGFDGILYKEISRHGQMNDIPDRYLGSSKISFSF